jgi:archaeal flagellar protein FlaF
MAAASLVATAIGILLLIVTGYILAAGMITLSETMLSAEKEMTSISTTITGSSIHITGSSGINPINLTVYNTGSVGIKDFEHMEIYLQNGDNAPVYYGYSPNAGTGYWTKLMIDPDTIYPNTWDPGETMTILVTTDGTPYSWVKVTTPTGVSASSYLPVP